MKMKFFSKMTSFFYKLRVSVSDNYCIQSITVWFLLSTFYWHGFKAS